MIHEQGTIFLQYSAASTLQCVLKLEFHDTAGLLLQPSTLQPVVNLLTAGRSCTDWPCVSRLVANTVVIS